MMKKPWLIIYTVCLLIVPALAHAQTDNIFDLFWGKGGREIRLDRLRVSQMEMIPDSPRNDQPVAFRAIIANDSSREVKISLAVVDNDRVISLLNEVYLRPGNTQVDFPQANIQFPRGEQRCLFGDNYPVRSGVN
ncbi:MAG: hypothetical protein RQ722_08350 [Desulfuromonadales bacterium]|nr:hypothetical protein [Desulfuromonadales bacterium]